MARRNDGDRAWRRFDEDRDFRNRPGALDRHWGYGNRMAPGYRRGEFEHFDEDEAIDEYNAPDYWLYQQTWMEPGPYTGMGPKGYRRSDERIREDVCDRLTQHAQIDAREVEVEVQDGEVTLKGQVADRRMKRMVEANVEMIRGVIDVHNELRLRRHDRMEEAREKVARQMADKFPGGPTPTGPAGYE